MKWDEKVAIGEIDAAIREVKEARRDDGMALTAHEPIDKKLVYRDRLREAVKVLGDAAHYIETREDNAWARKDRQQALDHIMRAANATRAAIGDRADAGPPPAPPAPPPAPPAPPPATTAHPAYMTALGNLRQARALLERPAGGADVKWDEHAAIKDIDVALDEIRKARVDDGKPATEHAPIESKLVYRDRLKEAEKQLQEAGRDIETREDNAWAKPERKHALEAIRRAEKSTHEAMADRKDDKADKKAEKKEEKAEKKEEKAEKKAAKGH